MSTALAIAIRVAVIAVALWVCTYIVDGIAAMGATRGERVLTFVLVAAIFGLVNAVLKPVIKGLGCPLYVLTLGLISLVVNALLFLLVGSIAEAVGLEFMVRDFWAGFWGAIVVAVVGFVLHFVIPDGLDRR